MKEECQPQHFNVWHSKQCESMAGSFVPHLWYNKITCTVSFTSLKINFIVNIQDVGCQQHIVLMTQCLDRH